MLTFCIGSIFLCFAVIGIHDILDSLGLFDSYYIYLKKTNRKKWNYDDFTYLNRH